MTDSILFSTIVRSVNGPTRYHNGSRTRICPCGVGDLATVRTVPFRWTQPCPASASWWCAQRSRQRCVTGDHIFVVSATCPVLSCFVVSDCTARFKSCEKHFVLMLAGPRPTSQFALVRCHLCVLRRQRDFIETILVIIIFLTHLSKTTQERKNHCNVCGFCQVSTVSRHVRSTQTEHINNHNVVA